MNPGGSPLRAACVAAAALAVAACATVSDIRPGVETQASTDTRGRTIAVYRCAACHAVEGRGPGRDAAAPAFRDLRHRYDRLTLARRMQALAVDGHGRMPGYQFAVSDIDAITAYIATVR